VRLLVAVPLLVVTFAAGAALDATDGVCEFLPIAVYAVDDPVEPAVPLGAAPASPPSVPHLPHATAPAGSTDCEATP
jgi:hypothetical protein